MTEELQELLKKELLSASKSVKLLQDSYDKCQKIGLKSVYSSQDLESFEALTARFSRLSDLLLQKIFRLMDTLELINDGTLLDRVNRAEKRGILGSAKEFTQMRLLRNLIVHEYETDEYTHIFKDVLKFTPFLLECVKNTTQYCNKFQ